MIREQLLVRRCAAFWPPLNLPLDTNGCHCIRFRPPEQFRFLLSLSLSLSLSVCLSVCLSLFFSFPFSLSNWGYQSIYPSVFLDLSASEDVPCVCQCLNM